MVSRVGQTSRNHGVSSNCLQTFSRESAVSLMSANFAIIARAPNYILEQPVPKYHSDQNDKFCT